MLIIKTLFMTKLSLITIFFLINISLLFAQDCGTIVKNIDLGGDETVWNSSVSNDGFVYLGGEVTRPGGIKGAFIIKTDTLGNVIWSRVIPGTGEQLFRKVQVTSDSGVITVGRTSTYPINPRFAAMVIKWDKNGNRQWSKSFNSNSQNGDWGLGILETSDGGYLLTGNQNSTGFQASAMALKMDKLGNAIWIKKYPYFEGLEFQGAIEENDSYILSGEYLFNSNTTYRPLIIKVDKSNGNLLLTKSFSGAGILVAWGGLKKRNGGFFFNGGSLLQTNGSDGFQQVVIYLDENLSFEKALRIKHLQYKNAPMIDLVPMGDGGFVSSNGGNRSFDDAEMYRVDINGNIIWKSRFGGIGSQMLTSSSLLVGDDFVFSGNTATSSGGKDILWIRTPTIGNSMNCGLTASDAIVEPVSLTNLSFSFGSVTDFPSNLWVSFNPAIEVDGFTTTYSCGTICSDVNPLPLTFKSVKAAYSKSQGILIKYETLNEINVGNLIIERSFDGLQFSGVGVNSPKGAIENVYEFLDSEIGSTNKIVYYRIKAVDKDGELNFSKIVVASTDSKGIENFEIVPNPSKGLTQVRVTVTENSENSHYILSDATGRQYIRRKISIVKGENIITLNSSGELPSGIFYFTLIQNGVSVSKKIVIQR